MNYFYAPHITKGADFLDEDESVHCIKVLRHKEGDKIGLLDGKGGIYTAVIRHADPKKLTFRTSHQEVVKKAPYSIHIAIAPTKNSDRMEWLAEKITEIGTDKISLFFSKNSERRKYKTSRLQKKLVSALKQSRNPFLPQLNDPVDFEALITGQPETQKFIAYVDTDNPLMLHQAAQKNISTIVLIGPEGDFTPGEVRQAESEGYKKVSLGKNILRTETAGLIACHSIHLINSL
jgi:16S rRNA (uracil1498-N3)-methyltransferase